MPGTQRISSGAPVELAHDDTVAETTPEIHARVRDALIGSTLVDRYQVEAELGRGGMGTVYRARHVVLDKPVALKVLHAEIADDVESRERFLREARIAAAVKHPHLVDVSDFGELSSRDLPGLGSIRRPWFVLELLEGETLAAKLDRDGPLDAREATRVFEQVARGLAAAHRAGAVHRDLKPDNVFLVSGAERPSVKVLDFGVARLLSASRLTRQGVVFGSPHYMSPEQASGLDIDGRSDVYSVGVALYESLSGQLPFEADSTTGVLTQHVFVDPEPIEARVREPESLGALAPLVMRCLAKRPEARFEHADALADALARLPGGSLERRASARPARASGGPVATARASSEGGGRARPRPIIVVPAAILAAIASVLVPLALLRGASAPTEPAHGRARGEARADEPVERRGERPADGHAGGPLAMPSDDALRPAPEPAPPPPSRVRSGVGAAAPGPTPTPSTTASSAPSSDLARPAGAASVEPTAAGGAAPSPGPEGAHPPSKLRAPSEGAAPSSPSATPTAAPTSSDGPIRIF